MSIKWNRCEGFPYKTPIYEACVRSVFYRIERDGEVDGDVGPEDAAWALIAREWIGPAGCRVFPSDRTIGYGTVAELMGVAAQDSAFATLESIA